MLLLSHEILLFFRLVRQFRELPTDRVIHQGESISPSSGMFVPIKAMKPKAGGYCQNCGKRKNSTWLRNSLYLFGNQP